jgi:hypothetical protein
MDVGIGIGTLALEMARRADEGYAMLYPVSCGYITAAWFVVVGA